MGISRETFACSICGERVTREFVHRNRAGAYVCFPCRAVQRNAGYLERVGLRLRLAIFRGGRTLAYLVAIILVALVIALILVEIAA